MLADRVRVGSKKGEKKGESELFLYNYGEIYGSVAEYSNKGEVSYNSDHIEIMAEALRDSIDSSTITFDTPLPNFYSKVTIESELIRSFGKCGAEIYFLNDTPDPPSFVYNFLRWIEQEHSKRSITLDMPSNANGKFFGVNLIVEGMPDSKSILKIYSIMLHN